MPTFGVELAAGAVTLRVERDGGGRPGDVTVVRSDAEILQRLDEDELAELCEALEVPENEVGWRTGGRRRKARPMVISTGLPHLIVPFVDRAVMLDVDHEQRQAVAEICQSLGVDSAALVAPGNSGTIADADVSVRHVRRGIAASMRTRPRRRGWSHLCLPDCWHPSATRRIG